MEEKQVEQWTDMKNMEKGKSNSDKILTIWKKIRLNCEIIWKIWNKSKSNSEKIWKIQKQRVKCFENYGRKVG